MTIYQGYTAPIKKVCARCGQEVESALFLLCEDCHEFDRVQTVEIPKEIRNSALSHLNNILLIDRADIAKKEADHRLETEFARYGY